MASFSDFSHLMPQIRAIAEEAGQLALDYFRPGAVTAAQIQYKDGGSPVTEADLAVDALLSRKLRALAPEFGWLSEETEDNSDRLGRDFVFVVDPIDGTRAFARGDEDWTIAIGIVSQGEAVGGLIHAPVARVTYEAVQGGGARRNGVPLSCVSGPALSEARIAGPRPLIEALRLESVPFQTTKRIHSLAYRFAAVTDGTIDGAVAEKNAHDWDVVAADSIVREAGGLVITANGERPIYNRPSTTHEALAAGSPVLAHSLAQVLVRDPARRAASSPESKLLD